jgi:hypothetical protein
MFEDATSEETRIRDAVKTKAEKDAEFALKHDSLCVNSKGSCCPWMAEPCDCQCMCDFITEVREDQKKIDSEALNNS